MRKWITKPEQNMSAILLALTLGLSGGLAYTTYEIRELKALVVSVQKSAEEADKTKENDVEIAEHYTIKATTKISDAYRSKDTSKLNDKEKETLQMASSVLDQIIKNDMSDFEKEKAVYEWMTSHLSTDEGTLTVVSTAGQDVDNPYGVLKNHKAVCVGYATTFRMFMQMLGIDCMVVHNNSNYHSWNETKLDGEWYMTDIYSDVGRKTYAHFNITGEQLSDGGTAPDWDTTFFPAATGVKYNVAYRNAVTEHDIYTIPKYIKNMIKNGKNMTSIRLSGSLGEEEQTVVRTMMDKISSYVYDSNYEETDTDTSETEISYMDYGLSKVGDSYLLTSYYYKEKLSNEESDGGLSEDVMKKIDDSVDAYFGKPDKKGKKDKKHKKHKKEEATETSEVV